MEAAPPSYENATLTDVWDVVAHYIPSSDLCAAALVCSKWHAVFAPHLWGNPASHFGIENDRVYVALTKFKRTLDSARMLVRTLTHTLHLPPAHAEIYNGPQPDWLRHILSRLPNLQSLIVRGLPFFDYAALQDLRNWKPSASRERSRDRMSNAVELPGSSGVAFHSLRASVNSIPSFHLRLLDASRCVNLTSDSLAHALKRFESLMYLDMSHTTSARDVAVLNTFRLLPGLQVLKLRGINMKDADVIILAESIGRKVRCLDVRDNCITDRGVRALLASCFMSSTIDSSTASSRARSPSLLPYLGAEMLQIYQADIFEAFLRETFTASFVGRLAIENAPEGGITHLYISNNSLTVEGVSGLIRSERLHVLDVATLTSSPLSHPSLLGTEDENMHWDMPGTEKLTPVLNTHARSGLTFLRIDHNLITKNAGKAQLEEQFVKRVELDDTSGPAQPLAAELDAPYTQARPFELAANDPTPRYELVGDSMRFIVSPAINDSVHTVEDQSRDRSVRRGSAFAPEVVVDSGKIPMVSDSTSSTPAAPGAAATAKHTSNSSALLPSTSINRPEPSRPRTYSNLVLERRARLHQHTTQDHNLHPAMLPHLHTLILTNVPAFSRTSDVADRLVTFIRNCAKEGSSAKAQAKLDYSLPPGRRGQATAIKQATNKIFALQRLVLEIAADTVDKQRSRARQWHNASSKSMTEDRDSEALWSAAETDFSFFTDSDECAFPSIESGQPAASLVSSDKEVMVRRGHSIAREPRGQSQVSTVDNMAVLSAFRKDRRLVHQRRVAAGELDAETEGYWEGLVQVVRAGPNAYVDDDVAYYGSSRNNFPYR